MLRIRARCGANKDRLIHLSTPEQSKTPLTMAIKPVWSILPARNKTAHLYSCGYKFGHSNKEQATGLPDIFFQELLAVRHCSFSAKIAYKIPIVYEFIH